MDYPAEVLNKDGLIYLWSVIKASFGTIKTVKVNGVTLEITATDGSINISIPTDNNQLDNGAGYQTSEQVQSAITTALSDITGISFEIVTQLPTTGSGGTIYLILNDGTAPNIYDEYIYINSAWEKIGTTDVDLSGYLKTTDVIAITNAQIDAICT